MHWKSTLYTFYIVLTLVIIMTCTTRFGKTCETLTINFMIISL